MVYPILSEMKITLTLTSLHSWTEKPSQQLMKVLQSRKQKNKYLGFSYWRENKIMKYSIRSV